MTATSTPQTGKIRIKNTLGQTIPVQLWEEVTDGDTGETKRVMRQKNLTRKETFEIDRSQITPALQAQIDSKILKVRK